jgi:hypothetical protein
MADEDEDRFEVIERPPPPKKRGVEVIAAILETLTTGKAIRVPIRQGQDSALVRNRFANNSRIKASGGRVRGFEADGHMVLWLEPKSQKEE